VKVLACYVPDSLDRWYAAEDGRLTRLKHLASEANEDLYFHMKKVYSNLVFFLVLT
jgi:hypothetical protein